MRKTSVLTLMFTGALALSASPAFAEDSVGDPVRQVASSDAPWETLDAMDEDSQQVVLDWINSSSDEEVGEVFDESADSPEVTPFGSPANDGFPWGTAEKAACVVQVDLVSCNTAAKDADIASADALALYPASADSRGNGDGFRHCYWSARMVHTVGYSASQKISTTHEVVGSDSGKQSQADENMDMANNRTGWAVGKATSSISAAKNSCATKATAGDLVTIN